MDTYRICIHRLRFGGGGEGALLMKSLKRMNIFDPGTLVRMFPKEIRRFLLTLYVRG